MVSKTNETEDSRLERRRRKAQEKDAAGYAEKRAQILVSAAEAFREEGYDKTTLNDIATRAGTDRASVYYYASSKEELFQQVCSGMLQANLDAALAIQAEEITAGEKLEKIIQHHMKIHEGAYLQWTVLVQELRRVAGSATEWGRQEIERMRAYEGVVRDVLSQGIEDGEFRDDLKIDLVVHSIFGMLNWTHRWYRPEGKHSASEIAATFSQLVGKGMDARRG